MIRVVDAHLGMQTYVARLELGFSVEEEEAL
jgi:hypothetical protein